MSHVLATIALEDPSPAALFTHAAHKLSNLGYDRVSYFNRKVYGLTPEAVPETITYSRDWLEHYHREKFLEKDVLHPLAAQYGRVISWDRVLQTLPLNKEQKRVFDDAHGAGNRHGVTIPFHGPEGMRATFTIATSGSEKDVSGTTPEVLALSGEFHALFEDLTFKEEGLPAVPHLYPRERECLKWLAAGKSAWEIAQIMGLAQNTVETYLKRARQKLNVTSGPAAVITAVKLGLIDL